MARLEWQNAGEYLPQGLRDFHDQKDFFKCMHFLYRGPCADRMPTWVDGQIYVIDWFLWFMASRGYTLQKTRKKGIDFLQWPEYNKLAPHIGSSLLP